MNSLSLFRNLYGIGNRNVLRHALIIRNITGNHSRLPVNIGLLFVPQQEAWIIQRFGKFLKVLEPGLNFAIPVVDQVAYVQSLKELAIDIPDQSAITVDNVVLQINGVLYLRVKDPYAASYGVENAEFAITQLAQTTMRSELGKITLDQVFKEREHLNFNIVEAINKAADPWGIKCLRYEIKDILIPDKIKHAMQLQVEAERKKRAIILESEGTRLAEINVAEGEKSARILASEAQMQEKINQATGEAEAIINVARARADAIQKVALAIKGDGASGEGAVAMTLAERYINAFGELAKKNNTMLLSADTTSVANMVAQAMAIYKHVNITSSHTMTSSASSNISDDDVKPENFNKRDTSNVIDVGSGTSLPRNKPSITTSSTTQLQK